MHGRRNPKILRIYNIYIYIHSPKGRPFFYKQVVNSTSMLVPGRFVFCVFIRKPIILICCIKDYSSNISKRWATFYFIRAIYSLQLEFGRLPPGDEESVIVSSFEHHLEPNLGPSSSLQVWFTKMICDTIRSTRKNP